MNNVLSGADEKDRSKQDRLERSEKARAKRREIKKLREEKRDEQ